MGLISLTWVFCHNLIKIHLVIIEMLSFSCSVLILVKADGDHLAVPNCKKSIWLNAKIIVIQRWYNSTKDFFSSFILGYFFSKGCHLAGLFLFNCKTTHCKNHFDTNLVN